MLTPAYPIQALCPYFSQAAALGRSPFFSGKTNPAFFRFVVSCAQQVFPVTPNAR